MRIPSLVFRIIIVPLFQLNVFYDVTSGLKYSIRGALYFIQVVCLSLKYASIVNSN